MYYTCTESKAPLVIAIVIIVSLVVFFCIEGFSTKSFIGTLVSKSEHTEFTYDHETTTMTVDSDGEISYDTIGDDSTTFHKEWKLAFYVEGELKEVYVDRKSYTVYRLGNGAEQEAESQFNINYSEPPLYTHPKVNTDYVVTTTGWSTTGFIKDISLPRVE